jgi:uncharacterized membrane protein (DUF4010 family)
LADVDAITLSLARRAEGDFTLETAAVGIGIAVAVNTIVKTVLAGVIGTPRLALIVGGASAVAIGVGAVLLVLSPFQEF